MLRTNSYTQSVDIVLHAMLLLIRAKDADWRSELLKQREYANIVL